MNAEEKGRAAPFRDLPLGGFMLTASHLFPAICEWLLSYPNLALNVPTIDQESWEAFKEIVVAP